MTDEQIMQGLKWCYQVEGSCGDCPYRPDDIKKAKCHDRLGNDVIELIERQKAEIKMLKTENERVKTNIYKMAIDKALAEKARAEAIKEFAEKLKDGYSEFDEQHEVILYDNLVCAIDDLVDEMGCGE